MNEAQYQHKLEELFVRFPSVQKTGFGDAYKPGLAHMEAFGALLGHPDGEFRTVHVAGTNGKGSVANMLASALAATGLKVGLYTSPHILDFRERMRILDAGSDGPARMIGKEEVWDFICRWEKTFDELDLSFFEITTGMAFRWFADEEVDLAVIEVGLGGRLDSTNIITPEVCVVTSIGLDHCAMLGDTRAAIAGEKAGIFKPGVPAVVGTRDDETAPVFEAAAAAVGCPLFFADAYFGGQGNCSADPSAFAKSSAIPLSSSNSLISGMDLQGEWQEENLRTVMTVLGVMGVETTDEVLQAIAHTARRMDFHGRWEMLRREPDMLCDIGHNPPALARNFAQLQQYLSEGRYDILIMVYGVMADKDLDGIIPLMPREAVWIAVAPDTPRAMKADVLYGRLRESLPGEVLFGGSVADGLALALDIARSETPEKALIYIGGSTFVVSEAVVYLSHE
ncbi:MAG: bifunctional folylpolyglutamate synthase/dihydrofolate synthase [Clostridia bacterium]|nr:bifunctional folylpolyglutamate synthase/dihydrofolate synthase [Clostridia bacterium]